MKYRKLSAAVLGLLAIGLIPFHLLAFEWKPLEPGPNDPTTAILTARMMERAHYSQTPINDEVSSKFLDHYLNTLDPQHLFFIQADLDEFEKWRTKLDDMTVNTGDTSPAYIIFNKLIERMRQQQTYVTNLLETEKFDFTSNDSYYYNRKNTPRPKDLKEAKQLWRDRLRYEYLTEKLNKKSHEEIVKIITRRYERILRIMETFDSDQVLSRYLNSLTTIYDPHSDYMSKAEMDNFSIGMKLSLVGIGAQLTSEDGYCKILELIPGGPAARSKKLKPNDKIIAVSQGSDEAVDVIDMPLNKIVEKIRGTKGTEVRLTIIPADASDSSVRKVISLVREEIKLEDQEAKAEIIDLPVKGNKPARIGLIDLPSFYADFDLDNTKPESERKSTTRDVSKLLDKLKEQKVTGLILDLRRNGGGSLEEAIKLTGLFIKQGPVVQVKDPSGEITVDKDTDPSIAYDGPMIVLTSRFSASASEILAGALQDYGRALIVGDSSTHGKGTVQTMFSMARYLRNADYDPGALKVTIRKFYRPSGASTQLKGVVPDIVLPSINNHAEVGEVSLDNALPWDTIEPADYRPVNRISPFLGELRQNSAKRVDSSKDFAYIREDIVRFDKMRAEKSVSLNEAQRLKEKEDLKKVEDTRKKERSSRHTPLPTIYKISLKQAALPGLPEAYDPKKVDDKKADEAKGKIKKEEPKNSDDDDEAADSDKDKDEQLDITLGETEHILEDLIRLTNNRNALANNRPDVDTLPVK